MARVEIWEAVQLGSGAAVSGADVYVYDARTTNQTTVYAAESGGGTLTQPLTTTNGKIPGWVDEGEYDLDISGTGITSTTRRFNAIVGGNPALAADQVTSAELAADSVGTSEIQAGAVTDSELASDSVGSDELKDDAVAAANLATDSVTDDAIQDGAVGTGGLAANAVTTAKITDANVTSAKINLDAIQTDGSSVNAAGFALIGSWSGTGAALTLSSNGVWLVFCSGWIEDNTSSNAVLHFRSSVLVDLVPIDNTKIAHYMDGGADARMPVKHAFPLQVGSAPVSIAHAIWPEDTLGLSTIANQVTLSAVRLSGA